MADELTRDQRADLIARWVLDEYENPVTELARASRERGFNLVAWIVAHRKAKHNEEKG